MNRERAKLLLPVITAWAEGKDIEVRGQSPSDYWSTFRPGETYAHPNFNNSAWEWRIKADPREYWICAGPEGWIVLNREPSIAETQHNYKFIHVLEVL